jgi:hypothetical protein
MYKMSSKKQSIKYKMHVIATPKFVIQRYRCIGCVSMKYADSSISHHGGIRQAATGARSIREDAALDPMHVYDNNGQAGTSDIHNSVVVCIKIETKSDALLCRVASKAPQAHNMDFLGEWLK